MCINLVRADSLSARMKIVSSNSKWPIRIREISRVSPVVFLLHSSRRMGAHSSVSSMTEQVKAVNNVFINT